MLKAWAEWKLSEDYHNSRKWALLDEHVDGSLWAAFTQGWALRQHYDMTASKQEKEQYP